MRDDMPASGRGEEWQPISTAPKDETDVLLYCKERGKFWSGPLYVIAGWFHNGEESGWATAENPDEWIEGEPTHWQHLPPPPSEDLRP